jgi:hypothetical protein
MGALPAGASYQLVLPAGTQYGPQSFLSKEFSFSFTSTLPFRIPFPRRQDPPPSNAFQQFRSGISSSALELYLPHGLSDDTTSEQLQGRLKLEVVAALSGGPASPQPVDFTVNLTKPCASLGEK